MKKTETSNKIQKSENKISRIKITLELSKNLEKHLIYLETASKRSKEFIVQEALIQYLENAEDVAKIYERERKKGSKKYTTEELLEELNLKEIG